MCEKRSFSTHSQALCLAVDLERHDPTVAVRYADAVVELAHAQGLDTPGLDVLTDPTASTVTRERALAVVAAHLRRLGSLRDDTVAAAA